VPTLGGVAPQRSTPRQRCHGLPAPRRAAARRGGTEKAGQWTRCGGDGVVCGIGPVVYPALSGPPLYDRGVHEDQEPRNSKATHPRPRCPISATLTARRAAPSRLPHPLASRRGCPIVGLMVSLWMATCAPGAAPRASQCHAAASTRLRPGLVAGAAPAPRPAARLFWHPSAGGPPTGTTTAVFGAATAAHARAPCAPRWSAPERATPSWCCVADGRGRELPESRAAKWTLVGRRARVTL